MRQTHYEMYYSRIAPHMAKVDRACQILSETTDLAFINPEFSAHLSLKAGEHLPIREHVGIWLMVLMQDQGKFGSGKHKIDLFGKLNGRETASMAEALGYGILRQIFAKCRHLDGSLSFSRTFYSSVDFFLHQSMLSMVGTHSSAAQTSAEIAYQMMSHEVAGKRVYEVSPGLAEKLQYTELRGLHSEDVRLPFSSIYIDVPPDTVFYIYNDLDKQWHNLTGIYITEDKQAFKDPIPPFNVTLKDGRLVCSDGIDVQNRDQLRSWSLMFIGAPGKDEHGKDILFDDSIFFFRLYFHEKKTIDECLAELRSRNSKYGNRALISKMDEQLEAMFRWMVNVVMYASCCEPDEDKFPDDRARKLWERIQACPEGTKTRRNLQSKYDAEHGKKSKRTHLGRSVTIDRTTPGGTDAHWKTGRKVTVRTRVAGHWRRVRWGKNWSERRMTFVEPFWRGPELGESIASRHVLK